MKFSFCVSDTALNIKASSCLKHQHKLILSKKDEHLQINQRLLPLF